MQVQVLVQMTNAGAEDAWDAKAKDAGDAGLGASANGRCRI